MQLKGPQTQRFHCGGVLSLVCFACCCIIACCICTLQTWGFFSDRTCNFTMIISCVSCLYSCWLFYMFI